MLIVPEREAALLWVMLNDRGRLDEIAARQPHPELAGVLNEWRATYRSFRQRTCGHASSDDKPAQDPASLEEPRQTHLMGSTEVAAKVGLTTAAVTLAAREGRLEGKQISGRWSFTPEAVAIWNETRSRTWL